MERRDGLECKLVGEGMADIAGIGIFVGFIGQALISLGLAGWVFFLSNHGTLELAHDEGTAEREIEAKRLETVADILMIGNDIQMLLGLSYMINTFAGARDLDTYHLRLAYDIVSFVGVSNASALVCWTFCSSKMGKAESNFNKEKISPSTIFSGRSGVTYMFALMFSGLTVLLMVRLSEWNVDQAPGRCYHPALIVASNGSEPAADQVYVIITAVWMLVVMGCALFFGPRRRHMILILSFLQFPVHLYMALALRTTNQGRLSGPESNENSWDFGQTTAVVLLGMAVRELMKKAKEYYRFERDVKKYGPKVASRIHTREAREQRQQETGIEELEEFHQPFDDADPDPSPDQDPDRQRLWAGQKRKPVGSGGERQRQWPGGKQLSGSDAV